MVKRGIFIFTYLIYCQCLAQQHKLILSNKDSLKGKLHTLSGENLQFYHSGSGKIIPINFTKVQRLEINPAIKPASSVRGMMLKSGESLPFAVASANAEQWQGSSSGIGALSINNNDIKALLFTTNPKFIPVIPIHKIASKKDLRSIVNWSINDGKLTSKAKASCSLITKIYTDYSVKFDLLPNLGGEFTLNIQAKLSAQDKQRLVALQKRGNLQNDTFSLKITNSEVRFCQISGEKRNVAQTVLGFKKGLPKEKLQSYELRVSSARDMYSLLLNGKTLFNGKISFEKPLYGDVFFSLTTGESKIAISNFQVLSRTKKIESSIQKIAQMNDNLIFSFSSIIPGKITELSLQNIDFSYLDGKNTKQKYPINNLIAISYQGETKKLKGNIITLRSGAVLALNNIQWKKDTLHADHSALGKLQIHEDEIISITRKK